MDTLRSFIYTYEDTPPCMSWCPSAAPEGCSSAMGCVPAFRWHPEPGPQRSAGCTLRGTCPVGLEDLLGPRRVSAAVRARPGFCGQGLCSVALSGLLSLWSTGSRHRGSVVVAHGLSCPMVCRIFPNQGMNLCPLHWQVDS